MPRTKEQDAVYQRERRARQKAERLPDASRTVEEATLALESRLKRDRVRRTSGRDEGARSNYLTGDFVTEIQSLTQAQRDAILVKLPRTRRD